MRDKKDGVKKRRSAYERKQLRTRIVALTLVILLVGGVLFAALYSIF